VRNKNSFRLNCGPLGNDSPSGPNSNLHPWFAGLRSLTPVLALVCLALASSVVARAAEIIPAGLDYLYTVPGAGTASGSYTTVSGAQQGNNAPGVVDLMGVPTFGGADTIITRLASTPFMSATGAICADDTVGCTATIVANITNLNLESTTPVTIGGVTANLFVTVDHQGTGSNMLTLTQTVPEGSSTTPEGTFTSFFDVFVDIRAGSLSGQIVSTQELNLTFNGGRWNDPDDGGGFLASRVTECVPGVTCHVADPTPEPASVLLLMSGLACCYAFGKRRVTS